MSKLYEFAVLLEEKRDRDGEVIEEARVIVPVEAVIARDDSQAQLIAGRAIPDEYVVPGKLDRIRVAVRPF